MKHARVPHSKRSRADVQGRKPQKQRKPAARKKPTAQPVAAPRHPRFSRAALEAGTYYQSVVVQVIVDAAVYEHIASRAGWDVHAAIERILKRASRLSDVGGVGARDVPLLARRTIGAVDQVVLELTVSPYVHDWASRRAGYDTPEVFLAWVLEQAVHGELAALARASRHHADHVDTVQLALPEVR